MSDTARASSVHTVAMHTVAMHSTPVRSGGTNSSTLPPLRITHLARKYFFLRSGFLVLEKNVSEQLKPSIGCLHYRMSTSLSKQQNRRRFLSVRASMDLISHLITYLCVLRTRSSFTKQFCNRNLAAVMHCAVKSLRFLR